MFAPTGILEIAARTYLDVNTNLFSYHKEAGKHDLKRNNHYFLPCLRDHEPVVAESGSTVISMVVAINKLIGM